MNTTVKKVFMLIGLLVLIFLIWQVVFKDGGIVRKVYNSMVDGINTQWAKVAGTGKTILPTWKETGAASGADNKGFEIGTEK